MGERGLEAVGGFERRLEKSCNIWSFSIYNLKRKMIRIVYKELSCIAAIIGLEKTGNLRRMKF